MRRLLPFITSMSLLGALVAPLSLRAATGVTMSLSPLNQTVKVGAEFTVTLEAQTSAAADAFNAAEATLRFPSAKLQVVSLAKSGSVFTVWAEEPTFSNTNGTIRFAGGRTSGFTGKGKLFSVKFKAVAVGNAAVTLGDGSVTANDGKATNVLALFIPGHYAVSDQAGNVQLEPGDLIKLPDDRNPATTVDTAVYYYGVDGLRYVFPNSKTYFTWYADFNNVKEVNLAQLGTIGIGGNVTYRPGVRMVKVESDPKVYAVERGGERKAVPSEAVAAALYGANWNKMIDDVPDSFFTNYFDGAALAADTTWRATEATAATTSIAADKVMVAPQEVILAPDGSFSPASVTVARLRTVRFTNNTGATARVASNPHPTHTDLPGFDSANVPAGLNYVYRFSQAGTFTFHNHAVPSKTGTVTVTP
ncbi:hypothetical protein HY628_02885 [Candidatus Uhrbacteria bacterium]|nr:hypothetical protein [Candidatus Uhrbacteria bacterium]